MTGTTGLRLMTRRLILAQPGPSRSELVTVTVDACETGTEVTVEHVQIPDERLKTDHAAGWAACIDRLAAYA